MNKHRKTWTAKDSNLAWDMKKAGWTAMAIGDHLGRTETSVQVHISKIKSRFSSVNAAEDLFDHTVNKKTSNRPKNSKGASIKTVSLAKPSYGIEIVVLSCSLGLLAGTLLSAFVSV